MFFVIRPYLQKRINNLIEHLVKSIITLVSASKLPDKTISKDMNEEEVEEIIIFYSLHYG